MGSRLCDLPIDLAKIVGFDFNHAVISNGGVSGSALHTFSPVRTSPVRCTPPVGHRCSRNGAALRCRALQPVVDPVGEVEPGVLAEELAGLVVGDSAVAGRSG